MSITLRNIKVWNTGEVIALEVPGPAAAYIAAPSAVALYFEAQLAATQVKAELSGEGADELFAGYIDYGVHTTFTPLKVVTRRLTHLPAGARKALAKINRVIDARMKDDFARTYESVNANFQEIFSTLFPGGTAHLSLVDPDDMENTGVEVSAQPRGKRITKMSLMSGGEKSLTAIALLFAVYRIRTTPFYILDEVEAALDDTNLRRLIAFVESLRGTTQLIMITHQRRTMETADVLFGVSMQADGVTKVISQKLDRALQYAE